MSKKLIIACDGAAASGKSTGAKLIAKKYGLLLFNSGLYYRYASYLILKTVSLLASSNSYIVSSQFFNFIYDSSVLFAFVS